MGDTAEDDVDTQPVARSWFQDLKHIGFSKGPLKLKLLAGDDDQILWEWVYIHDLIGIQIRDVYRWLRSLDIPAITWKFMIPAMSIHRAIGTDCKKKAVAGDTHLVTSAGLFALLLHVTATRQFQAAIKFNAFQLVLDLVMLLPWMCVATSFFMMSCGHPDLPGFWTAKAFRKTLGKHQENPRKNPGNLRKTLRKP